MRTSRKKVEGKMIALGKSTQKRNLRAKALRYATIDEKRR